MKYLILILMLLSGSASAFSSATPVVNGYVSLYGCPSGQSSCWLPLNPSPQTVTTVAAGSLVLKASSGALYGFTVTSGASAGYVLVFDAVAAPADGTVTPAMCYKIAATSTISMPYNPPALFATGITVVFSTTGCFTKTVSATAFISGQVQ
jgi:hypothetical protein